MLNGNQNRVLGRAGARDLTMEEMQRVNGAAGTFRLTGTDPHHPLDVIRD